MKIYDKFGIPRKMSHLNAVERLFKLKTSNGSNPWPVIEECFKIWESTQPIQYKSFLVDIGTMRETRKNKFAASDPDPIYGGILRYTLDIPEKVMYMIRCIYDVDELPMNREFFREWARRFPKTKVAEKI